MATSIAPREHQNSLIPKAIREFKRLIAIVLYLWVVFGLYVLDETVILGKRHIDFSAHGFAIVNALVLAKVLLVAEDFGFGSRFKDRPLIFPILYKALAFSILLIVSHIGESVLLGVWRGKSVAESIPQIGGGTSVGFYALSESCSYHSYRSLHSGKLAGSSEKLNFGVSFLREDPKNSPFIRPRNRIGSTKILAPG